MFLFDPMYLILILPAVLLAGWAQSKVKRAFQEHSRRRALTGLSGAEVAQRMLSEAGLEDVGIEYSRQGSLSDHYDPRDRTIRLSSDVYEGRSLAALGVAAHEAGHALQHATGYVWLGMRNTIIPVTQFGSRMAFPLFLVGLLLQGQTLMTLGILLFTFAVIFQLITLPVEYNASSRAIAALQRTGAIETNEVGPVREVLNAAALTYLAAALMAIMQLAYLLMLRGRR